MGLCLFMFYISVIIFTHYISNYICPCPPCCGDTTYYSYLLPCVEASNMASTYSPSLAGIRTRDRPLRERQSWPSKSLCYGAAMGEFKLNCVFIKSAVLFCQTCTILQSGSKSSIKLHLERQLTRGARMVVRSNASNRWIKRERMQTRVRDSASPAIFSLTRLWEKDDSDSRP